MSDHAPEIQQARDATLAYTRDQPRCTQDTAGKGEGNGNGNGTCAARQCKRALDVTVKIFQSNTPLHFFIFNGIGTNADEDLNTHLLNYSTYILNPFFLH